MTKKIQGKEKEKRINNIAKKGDFVILLRKDRIVFFSEVVQK